jgi:hypothetical protein
MCPDLSVYEFGFLMVLFFSLPLLVVFVFHKMRWF